MNKIEELIKQYKVILKSLLQYGDASNKPQINQICLIVDLLEESRNTESEDTLLNRIKKLNDILYPPRGGLEESYIWSDDFDKRIELNKPLDHAKERTWNILNK
jgi:hypothetical protein